MSRLKRFIYKLLYSDGMTPLPGTIMILLFSINFFGCMTTTMCFSYLPKLVKSYGASEVETGAYAGYIASSVYVGVLFCSLLWGHFGDKKGDKLALLLASSGLMIATIAFGFSSNYWWSIVTRLIQGGNIGFVVVAKSIMANNLDESNRSLGFTLFFTAWTIALIIGPTMSETLLLVIIFLGFLVFPSEQYPSIFSKDSLFGRYHILLPNFIVGVCLGISILFALFLLPNDRKKCKSSEEVCLLAESGDYKSYGAGCMDDLYCKLSVQEKSQSVKVEIVNPTFLQKILPSGVLSALSLFRSRDFAFSVSLYCFEGFCMIGFEEIFPVFATTARLYNGLALSTSEVGTVLLGASICMLFVQVMITSKVNKMIGARKMLIGGSLLCCISTALTPTIAAFKHKQASIFASIFVMFVNQILMNAILISVNIMLNNSVSPNVYGLANGIGLSMSAVGRMLAPTTFGNIFSWSLTNIKGIHGNRHPLGFPFNEYFTFFALSFSFFVCALIAKFGLSKDADHAKDSSLDDSDLKSRRILTVRCSTVDLAT